MKSKIQQEIEDLEKEIERIKPFTPYFSMNIANGDITTWISEDYPKKLKQIELQSKLSQTKKCIEMFKEMIDECTEEHKGCGDPSECCFHNMDVLDIDKLKSQLDEVGK